MTQTPSRNAGASRRPAHRATNGAVAVPIYQTTSFQFRDTEHAANLFALKEIGAYLQPHHQSDERGAGAQARGARRRRHGDGGELGPGGHGARHPEHLPCRRQYRELDRSLWRIVESVRPHIRRPWVSRCASSIRQVRKRSARASDSRTRAYYAETLPNPKLAVFPIAEVARIGRSLGIPLIMDNTAAPVICRPFDHGAAIVVYSTTKYIGGHGTSIGGTIIDGGNFDWEAHAERFPMLTSPIRAITARSGPKRPSPWARSPI